MYVLSTDGYETNLALQLCLPIFLLLILLLEDALCFCSFFHVVGVDLGLRGSDILHELSYPKVFT